MATTTAASPYTMTVDLAVVESLGINLYSNAAAVLSELVANAYDADATLVTIDWKTNGNTIVVTDDGTGMTVDDLNDRFLTVGYKKRDEEGTKSAKWDRPFMGRKGIGKLSVFSIANTVTVYSTTKNGTSNGLDIVVDDLMEAIKKRKPYRPDPVPVPTEYQQRGTTIVMSDLKKKRADLTAAALRKRIARRFDVLDSTPRKKGGFYIEVNGDRITWKDRQELKKLEFIWEFGAKRLPNSVLPKDVRRFVLPNDVVNAANDWRVSGWIGTAHRPDELIEDTEAGSLKNVIILARKRPIQEGIIEKLDFSRLFASYVTGQIEAEFLDLDEEGYDDIATSDRQRLIEDDERAVALRAFLREAFIKAADQWSKERPKKKGRDTLANWPKLRDWVDRRPDWQKGPAEKMIGTIASLELDDKNASEQRAQLFRSGILAFERLGLRKVVDDLEELATANGPELLRLLGMQDAYEAGLWADILRSRVEAISQLRNLTDKDELEKVLQKHLYGNLWLLDASWERATVDPRMEEDLRRVAPGLFAKAPDGKEIKGRFDIRYVTNAGRHVIVELKRYSVKPTVDDLVEQGTKYYTALESLLKQQQRPNRDIEIVFVLGADPRVKTPGRYTADEYIEHAFMPINARHRTYDNLIKNAQHQYQDYLDASDVARELEELLDSISTTKS